MNVTRVFSKSTGIITAAALIVFAAGCAQNTPEAVFNRGYQAMQEGDFIAASIYFDDFLTKFPEADQQRRLDVYQLLASTYFQMRDFGSARGVFQEMMQEYPTEAGLVIGASMAIGQTYAAEGNMDMARDAFESVISATTAVEPRIQANWALAEAHARNQQNLKAQDYLKNVINIADTDVEDPTQAFHLKMSSYEQSARIYEASQAFEDARNAYKASLDIAESATGIPGVTQARQNAVLNWAHTYVRANDLITAVTLYDHLQNNKFIQDSVKPQLVVWKIESMKRMVGAEENLTPEDKAALVHEYKRIIENFDNTDFAIDARVQVADLVQETTPAEAETMLNEAIARYEKYIAEPPSVDRPVIAMFQIAQAYMLLERWDEAEKALDRIKLTYSDVPDAMNQAQGMLQYIQQQKAEASSDQTETQS